MNRFVIADPAKCIGCRTCEIACVRAHSAFGDPITPQNFHPRLNVIKGLTYSAPIQCRHCENAPCARVCPTGAMHQGDDGTVQLDEARCIGCRMCTLACPFGAVSMVEKPVDNPVEGPLSVRHTVCVASKCDLCTHRPDGPQCVRVCPTKALSLIDMNVLKNRTMMKQTEAAENLAATGH